MRGETVTKSKINYYNIRCIVSLSWVHGLTTYIKMVYIKINQFELIVIAGMEWKTKQVQTKLSNVIVTLNCVS